MVMYLSNHFSVLMTSCHSVCVDQKEMSWRPQMFG